MGATSMRTSAFLAETDRNVSVPSDGSREVREFFYHSARGTMLSARRVVARYLQADTHPEILLRVLSNLTEDFGKHESMARGFQQRAKEIEKASDDPERYAGLRAAWPALMVRGLTDLTKQAFADAHSVGMRLFLSLLQTVALPPDLTKKAQNASQFWLKPTLAKKRRSAPAWAKGLYLEAVEEYFDLLSVLREHVALVTEALRVGVEHGTEEAPTLKAGPFTLINAGNFSAKVMEQVGRAVEMAASRMTSAGFGNVCYGQISVTATLKKKALAFYMNATDEMFVRANVKPDVDSIHTICHELAHRLHQKFLVSKTPEIVRLYQTIKDKAYIDTSDLSGDKGPEIEFVSGYARQGGPNENFAEMVAYYALGKLSPNLTALLLPIIK